MRGEKEARQRSPGRVGRGWEAETRNHQVGNATGSAVGVLFASFSCPFSVGDGGPDEVSMSVAECLGVVGPFSLSSPGSDKPRLQLSTLPPPAPPKVRPSLSDAELVRPLIPPDISGFVGVSGDSGSFSDPLEPLLWRVCDSPIAVNTFLSFDSAFVPLLDVGEYEFLLNTANAPPSFWCGDLDLFCGGDFGGEVTGSACGGEEGSAHAELVSAK